MFKSGYIAIVGRPNVGKSTLLNAILGQKIAAVTAKPQTTRQPILGIKTLPEAQLLFLDLPGIHSPHKSLNEYMMEMARTALDDADCFLFMIEPTDRISDEDQEIFRMIAVRGKPIIVVVNKADRVSRDKLLACGETCRQLFSPEAVIFCSAVVGAGLVELQEATCESLSEGPQFFPEDQVTDQTERFLASEIIREKVTELTREEVPYSIAVRIESFEEPKEGKKPMTVIRATIICEKESQKGILIGQGGKMIKKIGQLAREEIEAQLQIKLYLELFVRVEKDWTKDPAKVREIVETF